MIHCFPDGWDESTRPVAHLARSLQRYWRRDGEHPAQDGEGAAGIGRLGGALGQARVPVVVPLGRGHFTMSARERQAQRTAGRSLRGGWRARRGAKPSSAAVIPYSAMGIPPDRTKMLAFATCAALAAIG